MAAKMNISVEETHIVWVQVQMENKASENHQEEKVVDPDVSLVKIVDCCLICCLAIEKCQSGSQHRNHSYKK